MKKFAKLAQSLATCIASLLPIAMPAAGRAAEAPLPEVVRYNEHIRPILSNNCFACHGRDEKKRKADLRLDEREGALADLDGHSAIVPGKPDESEMLRRVSAEDDDEVMPPPKSKKPRLAAREIALLRRWIEQGAKYEGHWALLPLRDEPPPAVKDATWPRGAIDRFILARLEREGIKPSPEADRATLIRRLSLDLLGLLPTPEETAAFVADPSLNAYEKLVARMLASPNYGERWGRHWLDQARYADSNGYSIDSERQMWPYRDWVIKALNDDMPFDRFTIEQLAGDLLPKPSKMQLLATAFHRNTLINQEGGSDPEQFRTEATIDRVSTTGVVWLGLTIGCAQCHSHKFDPITQREFYEFLAFFNQTKDVNDHGPAIPVALGEVFGKSSGGKNKVPSQPDWERGELARLKKTSSPGDAPPSWMPAEYLEFDTVSNGGFRRLEDNSLLSDGRAAALDTYRVMIKTPLASVAAVRLRVLPDESLPGGGPGTAANGAFTLTEFTATQDEKPLRFARVVSDHDPQGYPSSAAIDDNEHTGWGVGEGRKSTDKPNDAHEIVFVFSEPVKAEGKPITFRMHHDLNPRHLVGRFALELSETPPPLQSKETALLAALAAPPKKRTPEQAKLASETYLQNASYLAAKGKNVASQMIMRDLEKPRPTYLLTRGDFTRPDKVQGDLAPGTPKAVRPALESSQPLNRLDLARWLVHPDNPLTPRVTVNRIWMHYFGRGLVETDDDFGTQGASPTHPELLDWLARELMRKKWSLKALHREIVTSATYRQSSKARADLAEIDARNLLLARQERLRVEAEIVRDVALSASGLLEPTIGGPSVRPPQPDGVYAFTQTPKLWKADAAPARFRRTMYTLFYRSAPYPLFTTFDAPDFQTACTRRNRSDTPLQALTLANDPAMLEIAQGLAARLAREVPGDASEKLDARLRRAYQLTLSREPTERELAALRGFAQREQARLDSDEKASAALALKSASFQNCSIATAATLVSIARVMLNTDNFITREERTMYSNEQFNRDREIARRHFLGGCAVGLGAIALTELMHGRVDAAYAPKIDPQQPMAARKPPLPARAKNVIYLFMAGGPSQLDLFDDKPKLRELSGKKPPESLLSGKRFAFLKGNETLLGTPRKFDKHGQCGMTLSELLPHHQKIADDACWLRGMTTDVFNHGPAKLFMNTGFQAPGRPSMGSWVTYGLGSLAENLPGFVVMQSGPRGPRGGAALWSSGFLPTAFQGVPFRGKGDPILYLRSPEGMPRERERDFYDTVEALNRARLEETGDPEILTRLNAYEMAFRMQTSAPELIDLSKESAETLDLYGAKPGEPSFAVNCLLARRLVERGVRFVQLYHTNWDSHGGPGENLNADIEKICREVDQPAAALVQDLKRRGLLDDTLVIWGGEFGRTPMGELRETTGRDHHIDAFTLWLAGGGVKPGMILGQTDELGFGVTEGKVHVHDLHATILHLLGFDHEQLIYRFQGRDFRLTDVHGKIVKEILS